MQLQSKISQVLGLATAEVIDVEVHSVHSLNAMVPSKQRAFSLVLTTSDFLQLENMVRLGWLFSGVAAIFSGSAETEAPFSDEPTALSTQIEISEDVPLDETTSAGLHEVDIAPPPAAEASCSMDINVHCIPRQGTSNCNETLTEPVQCTATPFEMTFLFRGGGCYGSRNSQETWFTCEDMGEIPIHTGQESYIVVTALEDDTIYHHDWVAVGDQFTLSDRGGNYMADQLITIFSSNDTSDPSNILQVIHYHSSCSQDLYLQDQFGSVELVGWINEEQGRVTSFEDQTFDVEITVPTEGTVTSMSVASNAEPFFFNFTDLLNGIAMNAGDTLVTTVSIPIYLKQAYELLFYITAVTENGATCIGFQETTLTAGYLDRPLPSTPPPKQEPTSPQIPGPPQGGSSQDLTPFFFDLEVECVAPPGAHDCNSATDEFVQCESRPFEMLFVFNGGDCEASHNSQEYGYKFTCTDFHGGPPLDQSYIVVTALKDDTVYHEGWVAIGDQFTLSDGGNDFVADQLITIFSSNATSNPANVLQTMQYHTSCSHDLFLNDKFGSVQLVGWVNEAQGLMSSFTDRQFDLKVAVPVDLQGPGILTSLTVASTVEPFFFNYTNKVAGVVVYADDILETTISIPINVSAMQTYNLLITITGETQSGTVGSGVQLASFVAGYMERPLFPTLSPTQAPSPRGLINDEPTPSPSDTSSPGAGPMEGACELYTSVECKTASGRSCENVRAPRESVCNDKHGATRLEFMVTGHSCNQRANCRDLGGTFEADVFVTVNDRQNQYFQGTVAIGEVFSVIGPFERAVELTISSAIRGQKGENVQHSYIELGCGGWPFDEGKDLQLLTSYGAVQLVGFSSASQGMQSLIETFIVTMVVGNKGAGIVTVQGANGLSPFETEPINMVPRGATPLGPNSALQVETKAVLNLAESLGNEFHFALLTSGENIANGEECFHATSYVLRIQDEQHTTAPTSSPSSTPTEYPFWTFTPTHTDPPFGNWEPCTVDLKLECIPPRGAKSCQEMHGFMDEYDMLSFKLTASSASSDFNLEAEFMMVESLFVALDVEPFFLDFSGEHYGIIFGSGELFQTTISIPVEWAKQHQYNLMFMMTAASPFGEICTGEVATTFSTAYPLAPTQAPVAAPQYFPLPYPTYPSEQSFCGLEASIECVTSDGLSCQSLKPPAELICNSKDGKIDSLSLRMTGKGLIDAIGPHQDYDQPSTGYNHFNQPNRPIFRNEVTYSFSSHYRQPQEPNHEYDSGSDHWHSGGYNGGYGDNAGDEGKNEHEYELYSEFYVVAMAGDNFLFEDIVAVGESFILEGGIERECLTIVISSVEYGRAKGHELQVLDPVHFMCRGRRGQDIELKQDIGPLTVVGFSNDEQGSQKLIEEVQVTYSIQNNGFVPATPLSAIKYNDFEGQHDDLLNSACGTLSPGSQLSFASSTMQINLLEMAGMHFSFILDLVGETESGMECVDHKRIALSVMPNYNAPSPHYDNGGGSPISAPAGVSLRSILRRVALFGGQEWEDLSSYQYKAINWVENDDFSKGLSEARIQQRYALACIYYATYAVRTLYTVVEPRGWIESSGWISDADECSWFGLTCNAESEVEMIMLASNRITGSFPAEAVIMASSITRIDLFRNSVYNSGDEGHSWLGELYNLKELFIGQTNFEYHGIPPQISQLTNLVEFDCSFTLYFGPLVGSIFQPLQNLEYLVLSGNAYNSSIPIEIGLLPNLQFLYLQNAFADGDLSFMEPMRSIVECWVDQNPGLGGNIPTFIGNIQSLQSLSVSRCGFTGTLPSELGNMRNMVRLWLQDNMLTGTIPVEIGNMFKLQTLEVEENLLTGEMPQDVCLNRAPLGLLGTLEADCGGSPPGISCDCCTCCQHCVPELAHSPRRRPGQMSPIKDSLLYRRNRYYIP